MGARLEPSRLAGLRTGAPATYVKLLRDPAVTTEQQDQMIETIGDPDVLELDDEACPRQLVRRLA